MSEVDAGSVVAVQQTLSKRPVEWIGFLDDGEEVLWKGNRVKRSVFFYADWTSIAATSLIVLFVSTFALSTGNLMLEGDGIPLILIFSLLFIFYQCLIKHFFVDRESYILTNRRGFNVTLKRLGAYSLTSCGLNRRPILEKQTKQLSKVVFGSEALGEVQGSMQVKLHSFSDVADGEEVFEILASLWEARSET